MRVLERFQVGAGCIALAAMLAIASPGVRAVRAEDTASAGTCSAGQPARLDAEVQVFLAELRREQQPRVGSDPRGAGIVVLNNRGYNYGPPPGMLMDRLLAEAKQRRSR